jgi:hypothetical protein
MSLKNVEKMPEQQLQVLEKKPSLHKRALVAALSIVLPTLAVTTHAATDLGIDVEDLKTLILGLIATIAVIGTAYLTVLVSISAFSMIRKVIRG